MSDLLVLPIALQIAIGGGGPWLVKSPLGLLFHRVICDQLPK
jgi:hypothetical protein